MRRSNHRTLSSSTVDRLEQLLETIPAIVWTADAESFEFTYVSAAAEPTLGFPRERWYEPGFWADRVHPDDRRVIDECAAMVRARRDHELTYRMVGDEGRVIWVRDRINLVIENGEVVELCGTMFDITSEREAHEALVQSEATYRLLVQTSPDAIGVHVEGRYVYVNQRFVEIFGGSSDADIVGREVISLVHPDYADAIKARLALLARGESVPMIHEKFVRLDGTTTGRGGHGDSDHVPGPFSGAGRGP